MKTNKFIAAMLLAAGSIGFSGTQAVAATTTDGLFLYSFQEKPLDVVDTSLNLKSQFLPLEPKVALRLWPDNTVRYVSPRNVNTTFEHNLATGDIRFHRNLARYMGSFVPKLPTTDEALKAADIFLNENKLLPANPAELKLIHVGGLRATSVVKGVRSGPIIDKLITLNYARDLKGIPVIGPGSKIVLDIGEAGEILGLTRHWRELSPVARALSPKELFTLDEAKRLSAAQIVKEFGAKATFEFLDAHTAYFDNNGKLLQPVYAFQAKIFLPDQKTQALEYVSVIPAMRISPEALNLTNTAAAALRTIKGGEVPPVLGTELFD